MHPESQCAMKRMLDTCDLYPASVLDVGSLDVNGNYREMIAAYGWQYTGLDVVAGPNVDIVSDDPYRYPFADGAFEIVISGSTMEHVPDLHAWIREVVRVLRPGGFLALVTVWSYNPHRHPIDCWRVLPDGMRFLFDMAGSLEHYDIGIVSPWDTAACAWKRVD